MTNEEAIIDIRENIQPIVGGKSLDIAISAIEKQIPKRTEIKDDETVEIFAYNKKGVPILKFPTKTAKILCPRCGCENPTHPYCSECGQKIDGILS